MPSPANWAWTRSCAGPSPAAPRCGTGSTATTPSPGCRTPSASSAHGGLGLRIATGAARPDWARGAARRTLRRRIEDYLKLGPLGTAFAGFPRDGRAPSLPRVLLIDEIDKSDIDLPNDLLHVFEEGAFEIDELAGGAPATPVRPPLAHRTMAMRDIRARRLPEVDTAVECRAFPFVVMTSNSEREFPAPFLRRCIQLEMQRPEPRASHRDRRASSATSTRSPIDLCRDHREIIEAFDEDRRGARPGRRPAAASHLPAYEAHRRLRGSEAAEH